MNFLLDMELRSAPHAVDMPRQMDARSILCFSSSVSRHLCYIMDIYSTVQHCKLGLMVLLKRFEVVQLGQRVLLRIAFTM